MRSRFFVIVCCTFFAFVIYGCSPEKDSSQKDITLNVCTSFGEGDGHHDIYMSLLEKFEDDSGISVLDESGISNEEWKKSILLRFSSGEEPDVIFFFTGKDAETLIEDGQVVDIDTIRSVYPSYGSNINTSVLNTIKASDGNNYAIPVSGYWEGLFINNDLFEQYNIPIPEDWDSFLNAVTAFEQQGIIPIAASLGEVPHYWFEFLIYNYSGPAGHLASVPTLENPLPDSWTQGLTDLKTLYDLHAFPDDTDTISEQDAFNLFENKEAAMLLDGSWRVGNISDTDHVKLIPFPAKSGESRQNTDMIGGFSMGFYITKKTWDDPERQKAAIDFILYMASNDSILDFNSNGSASPISASAEADSSPLMQSILSVNGEATAYITAVQDTIDLSVRNALFGQMYGIASGSVSIEDALNEFVELNESVATD